MEEEKKDFFQASVLNFKQRYQVLLWSCDIPDASAHKPFTRKQPSLEFLLKQKQELRPTAIFNIFRVRQKHVDLYNYFA